MARRQHPLWAAHSVVVIQKPDNVMVQALLSYVTRQPIHVVSDLSVGKVIQQDFGCLVAAFPGRQEQRCFLLSQRGQIEWDIQQELKSRGSDIFPKPYPLGLARMHLQPQGKTCPAKDRNMQGPPGCRGCA